MATSGIKTVEIFSWIDLKFSWWQTSQSTVNNTTTIGWKLEAITGSGGALYKKNRTWAVTIDGTNYTGQVDVSIAKSSTQVLASGTSTVKHNTDGTKTFSYSFSQEFELTLNSGKYMSTYSGSGSDTLTTIPRASTLTVQDGTLGKAQTITVTKRVSSYTNTITWDCSSSSGSTNGTICTKDSGTSFTWRPSNELAKYSLQSTSVNVTFTIKTYNGSNLVGSDSVTASYYIPDDVVPVLSFTLTDTSGLKDSYDGYVQGRSGLKVNMTTYGQYGAWIKSYKVEIPGKVVVNTGVQDGTSIVVDMGTLTGSGEMQVIATVVDSRGRTSVAPATINVLEYKTPAITALSAFRSDANGTAKAGGNYFTIRFSSETYDLLNNNSVNYMVGYRESGATSTSYLPISDYDGQHSVTNGTFTFAVDDSSYEITLYVEDDFKQTPKTVTGASVNHTISLMKKNGKIVGMAINKHAEIEGVLDLGFPLKLSAGIYDDGNVVAYGETDGDSIVECGETDGWLWRKWASGRGECRKTVTVSTAISTAWGTMYVGTTKMSRQSYPFVFTAKPMEVASVASAANSVWLFPESGGNGINGAYQSAIYNVCRPSAVSASSTYYITIDAVGKWK